MQKFAVVACLALLLVAAQGAPALKCAATKERRTGTLLSTTPAGCLNEGVTQGMPEKCFGAVVMNVTNNGNATGCPDSAVSVGFADTKDADCVDFAEPVLGPVGSGMLTPKADGTSSVRGSFMEGAAGNFTGSSDPKGTFIISVEGVECSLTYATKLVGKPQALDNVTAEAVPGKAPAAATAAAPAPATPAAPAKSSAAAAGVSALLAGAALVLAL